MSTRPPTTRAARGRATGTGPGPTSTRLTSSASGREATGTGWGSSTDKRMPSSGGQASSEEGSGVRPPVSSGSACLTAVRTRAISLATRAQSPRRSGGGVRRGLHPGDQTDRKRPDGGEAGIPLLVGEAKIGAAVFTQRKSANFPLGPRSYRTENYRTQTNLFAKLRIRQRKAIFMSQKFPH